MLRLHKGRLPVDQRNGVGYCAFVFPDSTEVRWLDKLPTPGTRVRSREGWSYLGQLGQTWVVDEVVQENREGQSYTIYCVGRSRYLEKLRNGEGFQPALGAELLELLRHARETVSEQLRRRTYHSQP